VLHRDHSIRLMTEGWGPKPFHGRIVMFVSEHRLSAGETVGAFAADLARIVGTREGGHVFGGGNFSVDHPFLLRFPAAGWYTWRGAIIEGKGVEPDVDVPRSAEGVRQGRDNQLETAIAAVEAMPRS
jgi:C-terminal processing protease CtpA/Prc